MEKDVAKKLEEHEEALNRLNLALDRFNMNLGRTPLFRGSTWEASDYHIASWTPGSTLPLTSSSKYVRMRNGSLEIRGGALDISTAADGAHMEMTGDYLKTWDASEGLTFYLDFTTGDLLMSGTFYMPDKYRLDSLGIWINANDSGGVLTWSEDIEDPSAFSPAIVNASTANGFYVIAASNPSSYIWQFQLGGSVDRTTIMRSGALGNNAYPLYLTSSETTLNYGGAVDDIDINLRVETVGNANMLFVDGGEDRVGIGTGTPSATLDVVGSLEVTGQQHQQGEYFGTITALGRKVVEDNVVTSVIRITTANETGDVDGGFYTAVVRISVAEGTYDAAAPATKPWIGCFTRVQNPAGLGTNSAVDVILDGTVNAYNSSGKNIDSLAVTKIEVDEYTVDIQVQCNVSGTTQVSPTILTRIELDWQDFRTAPTIAAL